MDTTFRILLVEELSGFHRRPHNIFLVAFVSLRGCSLLDFEFVQHILAVDDAALDLMFVLPNLSIDDACQTL